MCALKGKVERCHVHYDYMELAQETSVLREAMFTIC